MPTNDKVTSAIIADYLRTARAVILENPPLSEESLDLVLISLILIDVKQELYRIRTEENGPRNQPRRGP